MVYSLADYQLSIACNDSNISSVLGNNFAIGGDGEANALDTISVSYTENLWNTESYATGSWVHNKNLSKVGTITVNLNMLSAFTPILTRLCKQYYGRAFRSGLTLTITDRNGRSIAKGTDCYPVKIPDLSLQSTAQMNEWQFTCGQIENF